MKKKLVILGAAALTAAAAVPALAFENEFHGMYKFMGYETNIFNGVAANLKDNAGSGWYAEQRARLQYIAKANDDLKLVTHFELDSRFGGKDTTTGYLGTSSGNDGGNLDADQLTLETKNVYLDFNCPITGTNVKAGLQPWADSYQSLFLLADMTGLYATKKFGAATGSLGWFRFDDNTAGSDKPGNVTADLIVVDGKFALNKDVTLGASYYNVQDDTVARAARPATTNPLTGVVTPAVPGITKATGYEILHMVGVNADIKAGPATIKPFAAYQFGEVNDNGDINAFGLGVVGNVKTGPSGKVNFAAVYLSGDDNTSGDQDGWQNVADAQTYFNAANMWLIVPSGQAINSLNSVLGRDLNTGNRGLMGVFAGYDGTVGKMFYNANIGYAQTAEERTGEDGTIGTEINAQVGYKLYDNLSISAAAAYAFIGDDLVNSNNFTGVSGGNNVDNDDPWLINTQLSYAF